MEKELEEMYELLKEYNYVFLDEDFISIDILEDEINDKRNNEMYDCDEETLLLPVYAAKKVPKPCFSFDDIVELLENSEYESEDPWGIDLVDENKAILDDMNSKMHELIHQVYNSGEELFSILIYADEEKGFEVIKCLK